MAKLAVGGSWFRVADESPEHQNFSPETLGGETVRMVMTFDDPDAVFQKALAAGNLVMVPMQHSILDGEWGEWLIRLDIIGRFGGQIEKLEGYAFVRFATDRFWPLRF